MRRLLARRGVMGDEIEGAATDEWIETEPLLAGLAGASVHGRVALGPRAGAEVRRCGSSPDLAAEAVASRGPCHAHRNGFDLHAGVMIPGRDRARLERVCRYALRPPVADDRIRVTETGDVLLELRHRWSDGTTHLVFQPIELVERLAALTPRPRINLVLYYGVLGAHAAWRARLPGPRAIGSARETQTDSTIAPEATTAEPTAPAPARRGPALGGTNRIWAQLMARSFGYDVLACPRCGRRFRLIALIEDARVIHGILRHLGLPTEVPEARPARAPPIPCVAGIIHLHTDLAMPQPPAGGSLFGDTCAPSRDLCVRSDSGARRRQGRH